MATLRARRLVADHIRKSLGDLDLILDSNTPIDILRAQLFVYRTTLQAVARDIDTIIKEH